MKRPLAAAAIALMLFGVEIATGTLSLAAERLWLGLDAAVFGKEFIVPVGRVLGGTAALLAGLGLAALVLYAEAERDRILLDGAVCPKCGTHTKRVKRRIRHRILSKILEMDVTRRRCERCGWRGLAA